MLYIRIYHACYVRPSVSEAEVSGRPGVLALDIIEYLTCYLYLCFNTLLYFFIHFMALSQSPSSEHLPIRKTSTISMGLATAALTFGCSAGGTYQPQSPMDRYFAGMDQSSGGASGDNQHVSRPKANQELSAMSDLPKGAEDVYLLLFRNNPHDQRRDDDFIAEAEQVMGYSAPNYWHTEIAYFNHDQQKWMVMGCRPPKCSMDFPLSELAQELRGYKADIKHVRIPMQQQLQARSWFASHLQGQTYNLAGPRSTNCADAVIELGKAGNFPEVSSIRAITRDEMRARPGISQFLRKWGLSSIDDVVQRDSLVFPAQLKDLGRHVRTVQF